jgi:hypothetical protein
MHRLDDVLDGLLTLVDEFQFELVADLVAHDRRAGNPTRTGESFEPCRQVDAIAIKVIAVDDYVVQMDADAEFDVPVLGDPGIALAHAMLDLKSAACRVEDAAELDQEAVAHHLEDAPAVLGDSRIEELTAMLAERFQGALFICLHQPAVANDVGSQYGCQPTLDILLAHGRAGTSRSISTRLRDCWLIRFTGQWMARFGALCPFDKPEELIQ